MIRTLAELKSFIRRRRSPEFSMYNAVRDTVDSLQAIIDEYKGDVPIALNVLISGTLTVGETLTGNYVYYDPDGDPEGTSTYRWFRSDDDTGTNKAVIAGATAQTYVLVSADEDKYISFEVTPVAATGDSPGLAVESGYFGAVSVADWVIVTQDPTPTMYVEFSTPLFLNETQWAIYWEMANYQELDTPAKIIGGSKYNTYIALSESGRFAMRESDGSYSNSSILESNYKDTDWHNMMIWSDGTDIYFDVDDGDHTDTVTATTATTMSVHRFLRSTSDADAADGKFNNLKTWGLSAYGGPWTRTAIQAETPDHWFKFNEGTGNTVNCEYTAVTGTITNTHAGQWEEKTDLVWRGTAVSSTVYQSNLRPMFQGVYDHYSDKSFFCFMQSNSDPYVVECDHSGGSHTWGTPQQVTTQSSIQTYNYPTIAILPNRKLIMAFSNPFDTNVGFAISDNPADCTSWTVSNISVSGSSEEYPKLMVDRRGYIYYFYKMRPSGSSAHVRWLYYRMSDDQGATWGSETLLITRPVDDPYGMAEVYMGYFDREPYQNGVAEKWWMAWTASGGFIKTGTHDGGNGLGYLSDSGGGLGYGTYYHLYNTTKSTQSNIQSTTDTTVVPVDAMTWDNGDAYGIAYHNVYHSDIYVAYFRPDTGHIYDAADNDLGTSITTAEMEVANVRPYTSPSPPASKDTGFINTVAVDDSSNPLVRRNDANSYLWNGAAWAAANPVGLPGSYDFRYIYFVDGYWYIYISGVAIYRSSDGTNWTFVENMDLPADHGYSLYAVFVNEGHAEALVNVHESNAADDGTAWGVSAHAGEKAAIVCRTTDANPAQSSTTTVYAYVCDKVHGSRSRVRTATDSIALSVISGNATVAVSPVSAVAGMATFTINTPGATDETVLEATGAGLDSYRIHIFTQ